MSGTDRVSVQADTWTAQFVDETGKVRRVPTKTTSQSTAERILAQYEKEVDRIKSGILTREELDRAQARLMSLEKMLDQYHTKMAADGDTAHHIKKTFQRITDLFQDCNIDSVNKIRRETIEQRIAKDVNSKVRAARTINAYVQAVSSFVEYMIAIENFTSNPLKLIQN